MNDTITEERKTILRGLGSPRTPAEYEYQREYVKRIGLAALFPPKPVEVKQDHDYEGAILARQEAFDI